MLTFVTLFLGLVTGPQAVELVAPAEVALVELRLDGKTTAELPAPPWTATVDFGASPRPHELVAVGKDSAGREIARSRQWVNLPRAQAEMRLFLEPREGGQPRVRVILRQAGKPRAATVICRFDGQPLPPADRDSFDLPPFDAASFHWIEAAAELADGTVVTAHLGLGAKFGSEIGAEMTAAPLRRSSPGGPPSAAELEGQLLLGGRAVAVLAVEDGPPDLRIVVDPGALNGLAILGGLLGKRGNQPLVIAADPGARPAVGSDGFQMRLVSPQADRVASTAVPFEAFPVSQPFTRAEGTLPFLLTHVQLNASRQAPPQLSDALAAAGVHAAGGSRPRAVLLVLGLEPRDEGRISAAEVKAFLAELRVPLVVWSIGRPGSRAVSEDRRPLKVPSPWGLARDVSTSGRLLQAAADFEREVGQQFIAWVEGSHLPQALELAAAAKELELAR